MSDKIIEELPAFPIKFGDGSIHAGMSLREYAAIQVMTGFLMGYSNTKYRIESDFLAKESVKYADALIAELRK